MIVDYESAIWEWSSPGPRSLAKWSGQSGLRPSPNKRHSTNPACRARSFFVSREVAGTSDVRSSDWLAGSGGIEPLLMPTNDIGY